MYRDRLHFFFATYYKEIIQDPTFRYFAEPPEPSADDQDAMKMIAKLKAENKKIYDRIGMRFLYKLAMDWSPHEPFMNKSAEAFLAWMSQ